jgi:hypothetical protein
VFSVLSLWWIAPYFDRTSTPGYFLHQQLGSEDIKAFRTQGDARYGLFVNVAALYGFWGDRTGQYTLPKETMPHWLALFLILFFLVLWGARSALWSRGVPPEEQLPRWKAVAFLLTIAVAFILSVGASSPSFFPLVQFLTDRFPLARGFRDSQKWSALLVLGYAYFSTRGVDDILERLKGDARRRERLAALLSALFLALPILYTPLMLWGFRGQLAPVHYPVSWFEVNDLLNRDRGDFKVVFLPWHQYLSFRFSRDRTIANPAPTFFDRKTIAGDNIEIANIATQSTRPISRFIEQQILAKREALTNAGEILATERIKYVILAKEVDWRQYSFLDRQEDLKTIYDSSDVRVYALKSVTFDRER